MSVIQYYQSGCDPKAWSDQPECVDPVIRALAIRLNDACRSDAEREALIGPYLFDPLGTNEGEGLSRRRAFRCADQACRVWAPRALRRAGRESDAVQLEELDAVVDRKTARAAAHAYCAANAAAYARKDLRDFIVELCAMSERPELDEMRKAQTLREACKV